VGHTGVESEVEAVWRIESARLVAALTRMVGDVGLAEEFAQDALVSALEKWPEEGVPRKPGAWLTTVARRRVLDRWRRDERFRLRMVELGREIAERDQWVIDGNYSRVLMDRLARTDTVVYLDLPLWVRLPRVIKRSIKYHGRTRHDLGDDCPERIDWTFLKQVVQYKRDQHLQAIGTIHDVQRNEVPIFQLRTTAEVEQFLAQIADSR
jgi:adenylate kinase family enzyme